MMTYLKMAQRKVRQVRESIYLLFDVDAGGNSSDLNYELDYMFRGAYKTRKSALLKFVTFMIEVDEDDEEIYFDNEELNIERTEAMLEKKNWKIISTEVDP